MHRSGSVHRGLACSPDRDLLHSCSCLFVCCRAAKKRFDEEEDFRTRAREAVTRLQVTACNEPVH